MSILDDAYNQACLCRACSLSKTRNKVVFSDGDINALIMFIGEAPGKNEDETGLPFIGRAGQLLRKYLFEAGYQTNDFYIANTVKCRPPQNRKPTKEEKNACRHFLDTQIKEINPKIIVLVGSTALESFIENKSLTITNARGKIFEKEGRKFFPIFHPSYLLRYHSTEKGSPRYLFKQDLLNIRKIAYESNKN
ncbi:uracil-DNA glycosylase [bacterium]|nr:uracil-DNA glycosylase [bacterium]